MLSTYTAEQYQEKKRAHEEAHAKYKVAEKAYIQARDAWFKIRGEIRASVSEAQLDEIVIKVLQDAVKV